MTRPAEAALEAAFAAEWPALIGAAFRIVGDLQSAEDMAQETLLTALDVWPLQGVPDKPGAWLMTVCRNRARNLARDTGRARNAIASMGPMLAGDLPADAAPDAIPDDRLRLIAMCCHPLLTADAQVALTLRMVGGLTTEEIARGLHVPVATVAQRIVRAKRTLREHRVGFGDDDPDLRGRLPAVLDVIYLIFNEGYLAAAGDTLTRGDIAVEAHRLAGLLTELVPGEPEVWALRALLSFQLSRWTTRTDEYGALLTLDVQDRGKWNGELIADGVRALRRADASAAATSGGQGLAGESGGSSPRANTARGPLRLQAELAACHATAPSFEATDWATIVGLYDELLTIQDTPVVELNRAVAVAMLSGPAAGIALLDRLTDDPYLRGSHRVWAVRADLHSRLANHAAAIADYDKALALVANTAERRYLAAARDRVTNAGSRAATPDSPSRRQRQERLADTAAIHQEKKGS